MSSTASLAAPASPPHATAIPASPGPAPAGPPPVAGAGRPASPPDPNNVHRVQLEFKPTMNDELEAHAGDLIRLVHEYDDGWVGLQNCFPASQLTIRARPCALDSTDRNRVSFRALACPSILSSRAPARHEESRPALRDCVARRRMAPVLRSRVSTRTVGPRHPAKIQVPDPLCRAVRRGSAPTALHRILPALRALGLPGLTAMDMQSYRQTVGGAVRIRLAT